MAEKLFEVEYEPGEEIIFRLRRPALKLLRPEVSGHLLEARKDALLAVRSLIQAALTVIEEKEKATGASSGRGRGRRRNIKVE